MSDIPQLTAIGSSRSPHGEHDTLNGELHDLDTDPPQPQAGLIQSSLGDINTATASAAAKTRASAPSEQDSETTAPGTGSTDDSKPTQTEAMDDAVNEREELLSSSTAIDSTSKLEEDGSTREDASQALSDHPEENEDNAGADESTLTRRLRPLRTAARKNSEDDTHSTGANYSGSIATQGDDSRTLKALTDYLSSYEPNYHLDEDAIAVRMIKTDVAATDRMKRRAEDDPYFSSDDDYDEYDEEPGETPGAPTQVRQFGANGGIGTGGAAYEREENYILKEDFFKETMSKIREIHRRQTKREYGVGHHANLLDKRTINIIRHAMGIGGVGREVVGKKGLKTLIHSQVNTESVLSENTREKGGEEDDIPDLPPTSNSNSPSIPNDNKEFDYGGADDSISNADGNVRKPRRLTRGMARDTRMKRREKREVRANRGIGALLFALDSLEEDESFKKIKEEKEGSGSRDAKKTLPIKITLKLGKSKKPEGKRKQKELFASKPEKKSKDSKQDGKMSNSQLLAVVPVDSSSKDGRKRKRILSVSENSGSSDSNFDSKVVKVLLTMSGKSYTKKEKRKNIAHTNQIKETTKRKYKRKSSPKKKQSETPDSSIWSDGDEEEQHESTKQKVTVKLEGDECILATPIKRKRKQMKSPPKTAGKIHIARPNRMGYQSNIAKGKLFDEINADAVDTSDAANLIDGVVDKTISLCLLDWRRRQQWTPTTKRSKSSTTPRIEDTEKFEGTKNSTLSAALSSVGIDLELPSWEMVNPNPEVPKQPSTLEPPRRRHTDIHYANWCSKLIGCLSGSGRSMAHHEFFYSDIDRAWFNFSEFKADLARLRIPPNARLTRSEWSLVRRRIRKKPRRFSQCFIASKLRKLDQYRHSVRKIQNLYDPESARFGYEVPAIIRIGATVTAFNKKAKILHRGIVLAYDARRYGYLVQFERNELGYEFCPDTDVASHGVPEILVPATEFALDGSYIGSFEDPHSGPGTLPYGTTYGSLVDFHKAENEKSISNVMDSMPHIKSPVVRALHKDLSDATVGGTPTIESSTKTAQPNSESVEDSLLLNSSNPAPKVEASMCDNMEAKVKLVEKVAERETLVKLMGILEATSERKHMLLDAIEKMHETYGSVNLNVFDSKTRKEYESFRRHYAWLCANLEFTNQALDASLAHLQVMYGDAYAGRPSSVKREAEHHRMMARENHIRLMSSAFPNRSGVWNNWKNAITEESNGVGALLASQRQVNISNDHSHCHRYMDSRMRSASSLLFTTNYCIDSLAVANGAARSRVLNSVQDWTGITNEGMVTSSCIHAGAMGDVLSNELSLLRPMPIKALIAHERIELQVAEARRQDAYKELKNSISFLHAEYAALYADTSIINK